MNFLIVTHVNHIFKDNHYFAYEPYVREMNIWIKNVSQVTVVAPQSHQKIAAIDAPYLHSNLNFKTIPAIDLLCFSSFLKTLTRIPKIIYTIYKAMQVADHIHLRCPGNIGLLACLVQIFFPHKTKTAKYAGNWDPKAKQPKSYQLQKWILSNTFLTKNIQVLVYGDWQGSSKNIKPFFTASYYDTQKQDILVRNYQENLRFIFVGTLSVGKKPLYALQLLQKLHYLGHAISLDFYGEGLERWKLENYIMEYKLENFVILKGNQNQEILKKAYQESHFLILPSKSEGWPKAVAEAMFWGCIPIASQVSCVPNMLDWGKRGLLLEMNLENDCRQIISMIANQDNLLKIQKEAYNWSNEYTLNKFEVEVSQLINKS